jgi:hypothetical protein
MRKTLLLSLGAALLALASEAPAAITTAAQRDATSSALPMHGAALGHFEQPKASAPKLFSKSVIDPAHCNFQYVDYEGRMVVRSELKLTCTVNQ